MKNEKTDKIVYWVSTSLVALMMTSSAVMYLTNPEVKQGFVHLGFPDYFRVQLAIMKLIGVGLLIAPLRGRIKEWAYAGFAITFESAFVAHTSLSDPFSSQIMPVIAVVLLLISYFTYHRSLRPQIN